MINNDFMLGVNYWASNVGIRMWTNFDLQQIEKDFKLLKEYGANTIRMFPLWSDFQPIIELSEYRTTPATCGIATIPPSRIPRKDWRASIRLWWTECSRCWIWRKNTSSM